MYKCECGKEFKKQKSLNSHARFCNLYEKKKKPSKYKISNTCYRCECGREFEKSQSLNAHFSQCIIHRNGKPPIDTLKGSRGWTKGLSKETDDRIKTYSNTLKTKYNSGEIINGFKGKKHSDETKRRISEKLSLNNHGGKCKWFEVERIDGTKFKVQGTWEVRFSKVLNILDEGWIKIGVGNKEHSFKWIDDNSIKHTYSPDFYSPKLNKYFEVKGQWFDNKRKMELVIEQNNLTNIEIVQEKQLLEYENSLA